jgi:phosphoribosylformimino-5-aminoimidazole carboxamide ribotide isomerase
VAIPNRQGVADSHSVEKNSIGQLEETVKRLDEIGVRTLECEGLLGDVYTFAANLEYLSSIVKNSQLKVVVSGAIGTIKDLESVHNAGLNGVILDDVLYERKIDLKYAMELFDRGAGQDE